MSQGIGNPQTGGPGFFSKKVEDVFLGGFEFDALVSVPANTTYERGVILAINTSTNRLVPYVASGPTGTGDACAVLLQKLVNSTTASVDVRAIVGKGVVAENLMLQNNNSLHTTTTFPPADRLAAINRGLYVRQIID